jgi:hypothetical protein
MDNLKMENILSNPKVLAVREIFGGERQDLAKVFRLLKMLGHVCSSQDSEVMLLNAAS